MRDKVVQPSHSPPFILVGPHPSNRLAALGGSSQSAKNCRRHDSSQPAKNCCTVDPPPHAMLQSCMLGVEKCNIGVALGTPYSLSHYDDHSVLYVVYLSCL